MSEKLTLDIVISTELSIHTGREYIIGQHILDFLSMSCICEELPKHMQPRRRGCLMARIDWKEAGDHFRRNLPSTLLAVALACLKAWSQRKK